jgi:hypothetical protein
MRLGYSFLAVKVQNSKHEIRNPKWFDQLTILSIAEGQFQNSNFPIICNILAL